MHALSIRRYTKTQCLLLVLTNTHLLFSLSIFIPFRAKSLPLFLPSSPLPHNSPFLFFILCPFRSFLHPSARWPSLGCVLPLVGSSTPNDPWHDLTSGECQETAVVRERVERSTPSPPPCRITSGVSVAWVILRSIKVYDVVDGRTLR